MLTLSLKIFLETTAVILLIIGYLNEEKLVAFEQRVWKRFTSRTSAKTSAPKHSATYYASREPQDRDTAERARRARNAEAARAHAAALREEETSRRVA